MSQIQEDQKEFQISDSTKLVLTIRKAREFSVAEIRKFVSTVKYDGPTQTHIRLTAEQLQTTHKVVRALSQHPAGSLGECEVKRLTGDKVDLVFRISQFAGQWALDIRDWIKQSGNGYTGWSKNGIRIPIEKLSEAVSFLEDAMYALFQETKCKQ